MGNLYHLSVMLTYTTYSQTFEADPRSCLHSKMYISKLKVDFDLKYSLCKYFSVAPLKQAPKYLSLR